MVIRMSNPEVITCDLCFPTEGKKCTAPSLYAGFRIEHIEKGQDTINTLKFSSVNQCPSWQANKAALHQTRSLTPS
jgi:hypothetical protein